MQLQDFIFTTNSVKTDLFGFLLVRGHIGQVQMAPSPVGLVTDQAY